MRRFWYAKYIITLLASTVLTFHFLHSNISDGKENSLPKAFETSEFDNVKQSKNVFANRIYKVRRLSQGNLATPNRNLEPPTWIVLPGNITVHKGDENVPLNFFFDLNADKICDTFDTSRRKLLIFVASSADHFIQRKVIRETWGLRLLQDAYNYRIVFLLGKGDDETEYLILHESYRYGDLVQINLTESFRSLGRKSVAGLQWSKLFCGNADFVMKTDDDILVHITNLFDAINSAQNPDSLLMCHENRMRKILRKELLDQASVPPSYHKYEVSENELPGEHYPPYCSGMAYVFSNSVRDRLLTASKATPIFFIEDVYLTGFCRHKAGIIITPHAGISLRPHIDVNQAACIFRDGRITSQEVGADDLRHLWAELNTQGFFCPEIVGYARKRKL